jgi:hypothetical protein
LTNTKYSKNSKLVLNKAEKNSSAKFLKKKTEISERKKGRERCIEREIERSRDREIER